MWLRSPLARSKVHYLAGRLETQRIAFAEYISPSNAIELTVETK
jgi:hypothetical protein